jgi:ArsR family transcriptional regulator
MVTSVPTGDADHDARSVVGGATAMDHAAAVDLSLKFKAIADPTRLRLLSLVAAHEGAEANVCDLTEPVNLSQPTVSHHLKILVHAGLLSRSQRGSWSFYSVVPGAVDALADLLRESLGHLPVNLAAS